MDIRSLVLYTACGLVVVRTILSFKSLLYMLGRCWRWLEEHTQAYQFYEIPRYNDDGANNKLRENPLYRKALAYVTSLPSLEDSEGAQLFSSDRKPNDFSLTPGLGRPVHDSFLGARLAWTHRPSSPARLVLRLRRRESRHVLRPYLQHVEAVAEELDLRRRELRLFVHSGSCWRSVSFAHPVTLDTMAMDPDVKAKVRADLESFVKGGAHYHRAGRAWRRSYLLHGPPGTGKSSFAAAMAKFLCYDLYELNLSQVDHNADLRSLLLQTTPRSLILVEDLDKYLVAHSAEEAAVERRLTETLSVMDGVSSSCGEERVMVFTMGSRDGVDPAVLRPGRVDVQVGFPMCDFSAFKALASSYLGLKDHKLYPQVEEGFQGGAKLSPAEVSEIMLANRGAPSRALKSVISALQQSSNNSNGCFNSFSSSNGGLVGRRGKQRESLPMSGSLGGESEPGVGGGGRGHGFVRDATIKELRKLYGLIRRNSNKKEGMLPLEVAVAAAAAGDAGNSDGEKES